MPISDIYKHVSGQSGNKSSWMKVDGLVAKEYRERHKGEKPMQVERFIDGTTRLVNAYSLIEDPWIVDVVRGALV